MKLTLIRHLWGVDLTRDLRQYAAQWHTIGYEAVEVSLRFVPDRACFLRFLKDEAFQWVPQIFSHDFVPGGTVREHLASLREQMEECLAHGPLFFNAHSGCDAWSARRRRKISTPRPSISKGNWAYRSRTRRIGNAISASPGRRGTSWKSSPTWRSPPTLAIGSASANACWPTRATPSPWPPNTAGTSTPGWVLRKVRRCRTRRPRNMRRNLRRTSRGGLQIWQSQRERGFTHSTLTPEFGPPPYLHTLPHTHVPVADLTAVCDWMAARQRERFGR